MKSLSFKVCMYIVAALLCFSAEQNIIDKKMYMVPYGASLMGKTPFCSRVYSLIDLQKKYHFCLIEEHFVLKSVITSEVLFADHYTW